MLTKPEKEELVVFKVDLKRRFLFLMLYNYQRKKYILTLRKA